MKHKVGLYIGRFQPFHKGHALIVKEALRHCDTLVIAIGSAQEFGTKKNPFSYEMRKEIIRTSLIGLNSRVKIIGVEDRLEKKDDAAWGEYLLDIVKAKTGLTPTINFEGYEQVRSTWFEGIDIERQVIDRDEIPVSATMVREAILKNDYKNFITMVPTNVILWFDRMREKLLEVEKNECKD